MALIVEEGSGLDNANSFVDISFADEYTLEYGPSTWVGLPDPTKVTALLKATQYMEAMYRTRWVGTRLLGTQSLSWPRAYATESDGWEIPTNIVPLAVKQATVIMAIKSLTEDILPDVTEATGNITQTRVVVGPVEEEIHYSGGKTQLKSYTSVVNLVRSLLGGRTIYRG
jgi:hypothetical protein